MLRLSEETKIVQLIKNKWESEIADKLMERSFWPEEKKAPIVGWNLFKWKAARLFERLRFLRFWFYYRWPHGEVGREDNE